MVVSSLVCFLRCIISVFRLWFCFLSFFIGSSFVKKFLGCSSYYIFRLFNVSLHITLFVNSLEVTQIHGYHPVFWLVITRLELGHRASLTLKCHRLLLWLLLINWCSDDLDLSLYLSFISSCYANLLQLQGNLAQIYQSCSCVCKLVCSYFHLLIGSYVHVQVFICSCFHVFMWFVCVLVLPCVHVFMFSCVNVFMCSCIHVFMYSCVHVFMFSCFHVFISSCVHIFMF